MRAFCEALCTALGGSYGLASEHAHSCCVLMAKPCYKVCTEALSHDCVRACMAALRGAGWCVCRRRSLWVVVPTPLQIDGHWHTWIDYPKFHALAKRFKETDGAAQFTALDYTAPTPDVRAVPCE